MAADVVRSGPLWSLVGWGCGRVLQGVSKMNRTRATVKALPTLHHPPSPLRMLMGLFFVDAYWATARVLTRVGLLGEEPVQWNLSF